MATLTIQRHVNGVSGPFVQFKVNAAKLEAWVEKVTSIVAPEGDVDCRNVITIQWPQGHVTTIE
jgi:hypothetical protein